MKNNTKKGKEIQIDLTKLRRSENKLYVYVLYFK